VCKTSVVAPWSVRVAVSHIAVSASDLNLVEDVNWNAA
jgi:hypothetical protein